MNRWFYPRLALQNIEKNTQTYSPYILTCIGSVFMFFSAYSLSLHEGLAKLERGSAVVFMLAFASRVIAVFSVVFLFYTHSFLLKRRKKELGLLQVLGMEKRHLARVLAYETLFIFFLSLVGGMVLGSCSKTRFTPPLKTTYSVVGTFDTICRSGRADFGLLEQTPRCCRNKTPLSHSHPTHRICHRP